MVYSVRRGLFYNLLPHTLTPCGRAAFGLGLVVYIRFMDGL